MLNIISSQGYASHNHKEIRRAGPRRTVTRAGDSSPQGPQSQRMQDETGSLGKFVTCSRSQPGDTGFSFALSCVLRVFPRPSTSRKPPGPPPPPQAQLPLAEGTSVTSALNQHQTAARALRRPGRPQEAEPTRGIGRTAGSSPGAGPARTPSSRSRTQGRPSTLWCSASRPPRSAVVEGLGKPRVGERGSGRGPGRSLSALDLGIARPQHREQWRLPQGGGDLASGDVPLRSVQRRRAQGCLLAGEAGGRRESANEASRVGRVPSAGPAERKGVAPAAIQL